ncbi:hypothetical protein [Cohnella sp.]|uniref:hypothetical protein n=1 Tax=Cohnella sp. TaxID=1883426 RepID=UPI003563442C
MKIHNNIIIVVEGGILQFSKSTDYALHALIQLGLVLKEGSRYSNAQFRVRNSICESIQSSRYWMRLSSVAVMRQTKSDTVLAL